jgi:hypothetical protein
MNFPGTPRRLAALTVLIAVASAQQAAGQTVTQKGNVQGNQRTVKTGCNRYGSDPCPFISRVAPESSVTPGGRIRIYGSNLTPPPQSPIANMPHVALLVMGLPPGFRSKGWKFPVRDATVNLSDRLAASRSTPVPLCFSLICLENVEWHGDYAEGTLPSEIDPETGQRDRFWGAATAGGTYLQVMNSGGDSNQVQVRFARSAAQSDKSPAFLAPSGSYTTQPSVQPRNAPSAAPISPAQLEAQIRTLRAQYAAASPADKAKLQTQIDALQQQLTGQNASRAPSALGGRRE